MEQLIDVTYFMADRQDATVSFVEKRPRDVVLQMARLPGVLAAEPYREVPVRIRKGNIERRIIISGRPRDADLNRIIDIDLRPVVLPELGLAISSMLAQILGVKVGDVVEIDLLEGARRTVSLPISALVEDYFGIRGMMDAEALGRLMREAPVVTSVNLSFDQNQREGFYAAIKAMPTVSGLGLQRISLANFRQILGAAHHHYGKHLYWTRSRDCVWRGLQQRPHFVVRACTRVGQSACSRVHSRRGAVDFAARARTAYIGRAATGVVDGLRPSLDHDNAARW